MKNNIMKIAVSILAVACLVLGAVVFSSAPAPVSAATDGAQDDANTIQVSGTYKIKVAPDIAYLSIGVSTIAEDTKTAQQDNKVKMNQVYNRLKALGIAEKDIKTTQYNIYPRYEWKNGESILEGYEVNNMIQVTVRNLDLVGTVLDMTVEEGVNKANSVSFGLSDEISKANYLEALKKAVGDARDKAQAIASVYGIQLGKPSHIVEGGYYIPSPIVRKDLADGAVAEESAAPTPIAPGELEIQAQVSVVYEY